jgi:Arc/MetJ family transcription regulator
MMHMRTTLDLKEQLVEQARQMTGIREKTALVHAGLAALIERAAARRLARLGGTMPGLKSIRRGRTQVK